MGSPMVSYTVPYVMGRTHSFRRCHGQSMNIILIGQHRYSTGKYYGTIVDMWSPTGVGNTGRTSACRCRILSMVLKEMMEHADNGLPISTAFINKVIDLSGKGLAAYSKYCTLAGCEEIHGSGLEGVVRIEHLLCHIKTVVGRNRCSVGWYLCCWGWRRKCTVWVQPTSLLFLVRTGTP